MEEAISLAIFSIAGCSSGFCKGAAFADGENMAWNNSSLGAAFIVMRIGKPAEKAIRDSMTGDTALGGALGIPGGMTGVAVTSGCSAGLIAARLAGTCAVDCWRNEAGGAGVCG